MTTPSLWRTSFLFKCPACGKGKLYAKGLIVNDVCSVCNFPLKENDSGDGPAFFAIFAVSIIIVPLALWVDTVFSPPMWVHLLLWTPLIGFGSLYSIKVIKSWLIAMQLKYRKDDFEPHP